MTVEHALLALDSWPGKCPIDDRKVEVKGEFDSDDGREHRWMECTNDHTWPMRRFDRELWEPDPEAVAEKLAEYEAAA